eukprot:8631418-Pyramimonas_sp.AAC.2
MPTYPFTIILTVYPINVGTGRCCPTPTEYLVPPPADLCPSSYCLRQVDPIACGRSLGSVPRIPRSLRSVPRSVPQAAPLRPNASRSPEETSGASASPARRCLSQRDTNVTLKCAPPLST